MANIAAVKNGVVVYLVGVDDDSRTNTKVFLESKGFTCFDDVVAGIGWTYSNGVFSAPVTSSVKDPNITYKAFLKRFTEAEREALQNILATGTQTAKNKLSAFLEYLKADANHVDLSDAYISSALTIMTSAGILAAGRKEEILTY